jgi:hypothetical protein
MFSPLTLGKGENDGASMAVESDALDSGKGLKLRRLPQSACLNPHRKWAQSYRRTLVGPRRGKHLRLGLSVLVAPCCRVGVSVGFSFASFEFHALYIVLHVLGHLGHYPVSDPTGVSLQPPSSLTTTGSSLVQSLRLERGAARMDRRSLEPDKARQVE